MRANPPAEPATWFLARRLFLIGIGVTYAVAFATLWPQVLGLFGARGIQPVAPMLERLGQRFAWTERWEMPSVLWLNASDAMLTALCAAGVVLALVLILGILPRLALALLWAAYLSLVSVGYPFLNFQWDALLLEAGLLSIFLAPGGFRPFGRGERPPSRTLLWLVRWLLFRLLLLSGLLKLQSGDESWWDLSALDYHYWTQPLPDRLSHYAHHLPEWFQHLSVIVMFAIELGAPLLILGPRRCKQVAAGAIVFLMTMISATGNYGFFDLLTAILCIPLLDDRAWRWILRRPARAAAAPAPIGRTWRKLVVGVFAALVLILTSSSAWQWANQPRNALARPKELWPPLARMQRVAAPFFSFNGYGLFRSMTRERPELVIEGSADGVEWLPYRFRYKPQELDRPPVFAGLYMPRLDWQLWFAALEYDSPRRSRWYQDFLQRLLEGSPSVLGLLRENPFPEAPPRFVRSTVYLYEFSSPEERAAGTWWRRSDPRPFVSTVTLEGGELRALR